MLKLNTNYDYRELFLKYENWNIKKNNAIDDISNVITSAVTVSIAHCIVCTYLIYGLGLPWQLKAFLIIPGLLFMIVFCFHICLQ